MLNNLTPFHIAIAVRDIDEARDFYVNVLNCEVGRSSDDWVDLNLFGHQFVCHLDSSLGKEGKIKHSFVPDYGHGIPIPHFGVVLEMDDWFVLMRELKGKVEFILDPSARFEDQPGEQASLLFYDPSGNAIELKAFKDIEGQIFAE